MDSLSKVLLILTACNSNVINAQSDTIRVHFLYGSRPAHSFRNDEKEWFGGKLGGHVGIEYKKGLIIDFVPSGEFHIFPSKDNFHSRFVTHSESSFYGLFGGQPDSMKRAVVEVPISSIQRQVLDSLVHLYFERPPYDYAFFGMRCGAAGYDILSKLNVLEPWKQKKIERRIFYPRRLRKRLFDVARENGWNIGLTDGSQRRKWERDKRRHEKVLFSDHL